MLVKYEQADVQGWQDYQKVRGFQLTWVERSHQYDYILSQGLKPNHKFLDIGCGHFRAGLLFMKYLNVGNYYGFDSDLPEVRRGMGGIAQYDLFHKSPFIFITSTFDVPLEDGFFDYMLAQSIFTHLPDSVITGAMNKLIGKLKVGGKFYASFILNDEDSELSWTSRSTYDNRPDYHAIAKQRPEYYDKFEDLCKVSYLGEWKGHMHNHHLMLFEKE